MVFVHLLRLSDNPKCFEFTAGRSPRATQKIQYFCQHCKDLESGKWVKVVG